MAIHIFKNQNIWPKVESSWKLWVCLLKKESIPFLLYHLFYIKEREEMMGGVYFFAFQYYLVGFHFEIIIIIINNHLIPQNNLGNFSPNVFQWSWPTYSVQSWVQFCSFINLYVVIRWVVVECLENEMWP